MTVTSSRRVSPRVPWVNVLGKKQEQPVSAQRAYENLGTYDVKLQDLRLANKTKDLLPDNKAIVRGPMQGEEGNKVFNVVGNKYHLITPQTIVTLWDEHIGLPVTSIGALDDGERFFLATQLPDVEIGRDKDKIETTLVLVSPMNGKEAILGLLVPVRLVCTNGMVSMGSVQDVFTMRHYQKNVSQLPMWLSHIYNHHINKLDNMAHLWNTLADTSADNAMVEDVLDVAFPFPAALPEDADKENREDYTKRVDSAIASRSQTRAFFNGDGTGMDTESTKGTAYGLYNSVVELVDWGGPLGSHTRMATARSAAMGMAYKKKERVLRYMADRVGIAA
jgi:hypothetical protein